MLNSRYALYGKREVGDDSAAFFNDLWEGSNSKYIENVVLRSGKRQISRSLSLLKEKGGSFAEGLAMFSSHSCEADLFYSPNTFKPAGRHECTTKKKNLFSVYSFAVDVDFKKPLSPNEEFRMQCSLNMIGQYGLTVYNGNPRGFYEMIAEDFEYLKIPVPSYIECGHQLRLIYLLNSPVACSLSYANRAFRAIRRIQEHICDHLNATFGCGAEIQPITSFYRMSGSVNRKDDSVVTIWKVSGLKYEISELIDEYLPDLPLSKEEYRLQEKKKKKSAVSTEILQHNQNTLCSFRMSCFESLREFASNNNRREILTFLYVATALTIYPEKDPVELAEDFNSGFPLPLPHNEIRYSFRTCHSYSFTTETIARKLGLSIEDLEKYGLRAGRRAREKAAKEARGETRKQLADRNYENYKNLADKGVTRREIAKQLGLSVETLKKYRARRYKEESQI